MINDLAHWLSTGLRRNSQEVQNDTAGTNASSGTAAASKAGTAAGLLLPRVAASDALAAAVAHKTHGAATHKLEPKGSVLPSSSPAEFNVDAVPPGDIQQLRVVTVTTVKSEYREQLATQVASNATYICYGLKPGHIRVLSKDTAAKALFKGHASQVTDMAFGSGGNVLASCDGQGHVHVRAVQESSDDPASLADEVLVKKEFGPNPRASRRLAWHPELEGLLAVATEDRICLVNVPPTVGVASYPEFAQPSTPTAPHTTGALTCLAFSPRGDILAATDTLGYVHVWLLPHDLGNRPKYEPLSDPDLSFRAYGWPGSPHDGGHPSTLEFLQPASSTQEVIVTGDLVNAHLKLWAVTRPPPHSPTSPSHAAAAPTPALLGPAGGAAGQGLSAACTYDLQLTNGAAAKPGAAFFNHLVVVPSFGLVVLANSKKQQVYVLHAHTASGPDGAAAALPSFDYVSVFAVMMPVLSVSVSAESGLQDPSGNEYFRLYAIQTEAVQEYTLYPAACVPEAGVEEERARQHALQVEAHTPSAVTHPVIPPTLHMPRLSDAGVAASPVVITAPAAAPVSVAAPSQPAAAVSATAAADELEGASESAAPPPQPDFGEAAAHLGGNDEGAEAGPGLGDEAAGPVPEAPAAGAPVVAAAEEVAAAPAPGEDAVEAGEAVGVGAVGGEGVVCATPRISSEGAPHRMSLGHALHGDRARSVEPDSDESHGETSPASASATRHAEPPPPTLPLGMLRAAQRQSSKTRAAAPSAVAAPTATTITQVGRSAGSVASLDSDATSPAPAQALASEAAAAARDQAQLAATPATPPSLRAMAPEPDQLPIWPPASAGGATNGTAVTPALATEGAEAGTSTPVAGTDASGRKQRVKKTAVRTLTTPTTGVAAGASADVAAGPVTTPPPPPPPSQHLLRRSSATSAAAGEQPGAAPAPAVPEPAAAAVAPVEVATGASQSALMAQLLAAMAAQHKEQIKALKVEVRAEVKAAVKAQAAQDATALRALVTQQAQATQQAVTALGAELRSQLAADLARTLPTQVAAVLTPQLKSALGENLPAATQQAVDRAVRAALPRAVGDALRDAFATSVVPPVERATQAMFGQMAAALDSGLAGYRRSAAEATTALTAAQTEYSQLSSALRTGIADLTRASQQVAAASTRAAAAVAPAPSTAAPSPPPVPRKTVQQQVEELVACEAYEDAFVSALSTNDRQPLTWLLSHVPPNRVLGSPPALSQGAILSLLSHLAAGLDGVPEGNTLEWVGEAASALDPAYPQTKSHARLVLEPLKRSAASLAARLTGEPGRQAKTCVHIINSLLHILAEQ